MKIVKLLRQFISDYRQEYVVVYRILRIDVHARKVLFQVKGRAITFERTFAEVMADRNLILGLSSEHAAWLGVYYGYSAGMSRSIRELIFRKQKLFRFSRQLGVYQILYEDRDGSIGYKNRFDNSEFLESPLDIVQNEYTISEFDQMQACYLGMLAGITLKKLLQRDCVGQKNIVEEILEKTPNFRVLK